MTRLGEGGKMMEQAAPLDVDGANAWKSAAVQNASTWMSVDEEDGGSNVEDAIAGEEVEEGDNDIELIVQASLFFTSITTPMYTLYHTYTLY